MCSNFTNAELFYQFFFLILVAPSDYTAVNSQPVTFSSAPSQMCVSITIINDFMIEPNELFNVLLESTTDPAVQLTMAFASVTILDSCKFVLQNIFTALGPFVLACFQHCCSSLYCTCNGSVVASMLVSNQKKKCGYLYL